MRVKNSIVRFQVFVRDLQESFWGDFQGRTREMLKKFLESDAEQQIYTSSLTSPTLHTFVLRVRFLEYAECCPRGAAAVTNSERELSRRRFLKTLGAGSSAIGLAGIWGSLDAWPQEPSAQRNVPEFTGPSANPYWNSVGPFITEPQKAPLILMADRPIQLETPRHYFLSAFTPNEAFYVRWHLETLPNSVDLKEWRLHVEGNVGNPLTLSLPDLLDRFKPVSVAAVNQCSGNSRSRLQPRVPGSQWGNGAMGNAMWTGAKLREILDAAKLKTGSLQVQFEGLDRGKGPEGYGSNRFMKSLDLNDPVLDECIVAYSMNGEPLPMLNGFPVRLVVPGNFATYWVKCLSWIRVLDKPDDNFWMKTAYRIPDTPGGTTTPEDSKGRKRQNNSHLEDAGALIPDLPRRLWKNSSRSARAIAWHRV